MAFYGKEVLARKQENNLEQPDVDQKVKLRRRIEDYLRKYATQEILEKVADLVGVKR